ncbi:hypothetical protein V6N11_057474 [Hibiscus sabdariffa]|uniref:C3H1-type domain-containing protein n=1 Tax=Hibiscus sabdariffa TaxID=183260 RepID=A0ABR2NH15_9ROSI
MVNENFDFAEQQFISNFSLVQAHAQARARAQAQARALAMYNEAIDREIYGSDEFRMYGYKIKRCTRMYSHDWTECPFAHRGEKAQRRDPRKYPYIAVICPAHRDGGCPKGNNCELAHGVFEYWLHPTKYRTLPCDAGRFCARRVCFFAHSPDQLRFPEPKFNSPNLATGGMMTMSNGAGNNHQMIMVVGSPSGSGESYRPMQAQFVEPTAPQLEGVSGLVKSLRTLKIKEDEAREMNNNNNNSNSGGGVEVMNSDLPHLDWISELLK